MGPICVGLLFPKSFTVFDSPKTPRIQPSYSIYFLQSIQIVQNNNLNVLVFISFENRQCFHPIIERLIFLNGSNFAS